MRLIQKGEQNSQIDINARIFSPKSLKFIRIIHRNNSIYVYLFWKVWNTFIEKQGKHYDNKNKHQRRFHTKTMTKSISQF